MTFLLLTPVHFFPPLHQPLSTSLLPPECISFVLSDHRFSLCFLFLPFFNSHVFFFLPQPVFVSRYRFLFLSQKTDLPRRNSMPISDRQRALSGERRLSQQDMYSNGHIVHTEWAGHHDSTMDPLHRESSSYYNDDHAEYQHSGVHHSYHIDNGMNYHLKGGHDSHHSDLGDYAMHGSAYDSRYGSVVGVPRSEHIDSDIDMRHGGNPMMDKQRNNSISSNASSNSSSSTANKHPCKFPTCGWSFKRYEHLKRHMLVHTKERPFVCEFQGCEKSFSRSDNFSAHLRTHTKKSMHMRKFDRHLMMDSNNNFMPLNNPNVGSGGMVANGIVCGVGGNDDGRSYSNESSHYRQGMNGYPEYHDSRHSPPLHQPPHAQAIGAGYGSLDSGNLLFYLQSSFNVFFVSVNVVVVPFALTV